jgi:threonyl-tRNA synthetase
MESQIGDEVRQFVQFLDHVYNAVGLKYSAKFSTRPEQRLGDDAMWDRAEQALRSALEATGMAYELKEGDGAFYGPKIDFDVTDSIGRAWQLGTIQLDYSNPERFDLTYVGEDNAPHRPVIIHRAVSGSIERFIAILIEHFAGNFPTWLAPEQVRVVSIAPDWDGYASEVAAALRAAGVRVGYDPEHLKDYREVIKDASHLKVPYMAVIGQREAESDSLALRVRGAGKKQEVMTVTAFLDRIGGEVRRRALAP